MSKEIDTSTEAVTALLKDVTAGPWTGFNMRHQDHGRPMTPEEIGEYVANSVRMGDLSRFLFVSAPHHDGDTIDICHVGNGPCGPANTAFIVGARDLVPALVAERDNLKRLLEKARLCNWFDLDDLRDSVGGQAYLAGGGLENFVKLDAEITEALKGGDA